MAIGKKQKFYGGALVLALLAFVVDRCFFSPASASAKPIAAVPAIIAPVAPQAAAPNKIPASKAAVSPSADDLTDLSDFSSRVRAAATDPSPRDPFAPTGAWLERIERKARQGKAGASDLFRNHHHLSACMVGGQSGFAIVDGKTVAIGQSIDGFRLIAIHEQSVEFESAQDRVSLKLPPANLPPDH